MQDTGPVLQRLQLEAYRAVCRAMAVAPLQYVSQTPPEWHPGLCLTCKWPCLTTSEGDHLCLAVHIAGHDAKAEARAFVMEALSDVRVDVLQEQEKLLNNLRKELCIANAQHLVSEIICCTFLDSVLK